MNKRKRRTLGNGTPSRVHVEGILQNYCAGIQASHTPTPTFSCLSMKNLYGAPTGLGFSDAIFIITFCR